MAYVLVPRIFRGWKLEGMGNGVGRAVEMVVGASSTV